MAKNNEIPPNAFALVYIPGEKERVYLPAVQHIEYHTLAGFLQALAKLSAIVSEAMLQYMGGDGSPPKQNDDFGTLMGDNFPTFDGGGDN